MMKSKISFGKFSMIALIVVLQLFLFIGFSFADSIIFNVAVGGVILALIIAATYREYKKENVIRLILLIFPLLIYGILISIGKFASVELPIFVRVLLPFSFVIFVLSGYLFSYNKIFTINHLMFVIYAGIALISLINLIITLSYLGAFYAFRFPYDYIYYNGVTSHYYVSRVAYALTGFSISCVSIEFFSLFPIMLLSSVVMLFFISPKKSPLFFYSYLGFALLGLLSLILTMNKYMIIPDVITIVLLVFLLCIFKFKKLQCKATIIILSVFLALCILLFIFVIINAQPGSFINNFTKRYNALNVIFNTNSYAATNNYILNGVFSSDKLFGFTYPHDSFYGVYYSSSGNIFIDQFIYTGIFSLVFFVLVLSFATYTIYKTLKNTSVENRIKYLLPISFVAIFLGYELISGQAMKNQHNDALYPYFMSCIWLVVLFIFGFFFRESNGGKVNE